MLPVTSTIHDADRVRAGPRFFAGRADAIGEGDEADGVR